MSSMTTAPPQSPSRWQRWFILPVKRQLTQGTSAEKLAWTIALAVTLGVFPIMGTTSLVCLLAGWALRLNQPILQAFNTLMYPLHLASILVFIRLGEKLHGAPPIPFSIPQLLARFQQSPWTFAKEFGWTAWHGVSAWLLIAPIAALLLRLALLPLLRRMAEKLHPDRVAVATEFHDASRP